MKKTYSNPSIRVIALNLESSFMGNSIQIDIDKDTEVDAGDSFTKKRGSWDATEWSSGNE